MKELSTVALAVEPSTTLAIDAMFKQMKADGLDVIGFGAGEPDFNTPDNIKEAGIQAIHNDFTRYTPSAGTVDLRKAVCYRLKEDCGVVCDFSQVVIGSGAKTCIYVALQTLLNPGDEVVLPAPFWVSYAELIRMAGGVPVIVETREADQFKITAKELADVITDKTKCMILNNPSNPTGMMYSKHELEELAKVCQEKDIYVISDEIYYKLVYDNGEFVSFASISEDAKERTILINGVSKTYAMTGWRIGYAIANPKIAKIMSNYISHCTGSPSAISQKAATEALLGPQDSVEKMRLAFERRRNYMVERMNKIENVSCITPHGAFYVMMNIEKLIGREIHGTVIRDADDFSNLFLTYGKVAVVPCTGFGAPNFVRWSYATSRANIEEGLSRLERFLAGETV